MKSGRCMLNLLAWLSVAQFFMPWVRMKRIQARKRQAIKLLHWLTTAQNNITKLSLRTGTTYHT